MQEITQLFEKAAINYQNVANDLYNRHGNTSLVNIQFLDSPWYRSDFVLTQEMEAEIPKDTHAFIRKFKNTPQAKEKGYLNCVNWVNAPVRIFKNVALYWMEPRSAKSERHPQWIALPLDSTVYRRTMNEEN